jgi:hypothetical protein
VCLFAGGVFQDSVNIINLPTGSLLPLYKSYWKAILFLEAIVSTSQNSLQGGLYYDEG